ncbi:carbohydrate kinase family protein [Microbacterium rhizomatis]|uniref:carbohydrate kinase family protein n=1 Tax=Microbacterium rhizomatis TaxID=1631477 RepID=UPI001B871AEC|nr:PfkB family carbohydrate kinase [Microbacterium rhizomatis]
MSAGAGRKILVVGDVIDDIVVIPSGPILPDTDTPSTIRRVAGGSAANTAAWLGAIGRTVSSVGPVSFVGAVAASDLDRHAALLPGVQTRLQPVDAPTGTIVVVVDGDRRSLLTDRGANTLLDLDAIGDDLLGGHVHLTGHTMAASDGAAFERLIRRAKGAGSTVSVNPGSVSYIAALGAARFLAVIAGADLLIATLAEGQALTGLVEPGEVCAALDIATVVLTLGRDGAMVDGVRVAAASATVVDPTGAGDAFCAGFLARWAAGSDDITAARFGAEIAARSVAIVGGRPLSRRPGALSA